MKVSTENDNNFGYEQITIVVDNMPLKVNMFCFNSIDNEDMLNIFFILIYFFILFYWL
jgi:hypothetical protein